jgi:hypothetical protein
LFGDSVPAIGEERADPSLDPLHVLCKALAVAPGGLGFVAGAAGCLFDESILISGTSKIQAVRAW